MSEVGVSVIVPLLNEADIAQELIEHLKDINAEQVLIVDGGSQDRTLEIAQSSGFDVLSSSPGRAKQMNVGAQQATQSRLLFLHADTRLASAYKSEILKANVWGRFDVEFDSHSWLMALVAFFMNWRSRVTQVSTGDQAIFVDAQIFHSVGGFPDIAIMEDVAFCKRMRQLYAPTSSKLKVRTSARRWEQNGVIKTVLQMWWYRLQFFFGVSPSKLKNKYNDVR